MAMADHLKKSGETSIPVKPAFDKDPNAEKIARLMAEPDFADLPDAYRAKRVGLSVEEFQSYMSNPQFLRWAVEKMRDFYLARLPAVLNTIYEQAMQGKGRQQKMLLDFMKVTAAEKEEAKAPNITIITNIPDPDKQREKSEIIIDVSSEASDDANASL